MSLRKIRKLQGAKIISYGSVQLSTIPLYLVSPPSIHTPQHDYFGQTNMKENL